MTRHRGRPTIAVNPLELLTWWEGRGGRRPLSLREIGRKLNISEATVRRHLRTLREAGQVDDHARSQALATRGGLPKGGRPATPIREADLLAAWSQTPSPSTVARRLHSSRHRVRARLQKIELLSNRKGAPAPASSHTSPATPSEVPCP
jgi:DNA-binding CsgD family transcriptional regulator